MKNKEEEQKNPCDECSQKTKFYTLFDKIVIETESCCFIADEFKVEKYASINAFLRGDDCIVYLLYTRIPQFLN